MKIMTDKEIEATFGISAEQMDSWEEDLEKGVFHGEPRGKVVVGRPLKFNEAMKQVGFKETLGKIAAIDRRAEQLGMRRSDYLRHLVDEDLAAAGIA